MQAALSDAIVRLAFYQVLRYFCDLQGVLGPWQALSDFVQSVFFFFFYSEKRKEKLLRVMLVKAWMSYIEHCRTLCATQNSPARKTAAPQGRGAQK